jgi:nucleoside-triphosphatase
METVFLLTGLPGCGKTSLIKQVLAASALNAGGFYTEEIRLEGIRQGFRLVTLDGRNIILAHSDIRNQYRVSRYGVDVEGFDKIGTASLREALRLQQLIVIDEIGRMELYSAQFKKSVLEIIDSGARVLGTILYKPDPWTDVIKRNSRVRICTLTRHNHSKALQEIQSWLQETA